MNDNTIDKTVSIISALCCLAFVFMTMASPDQVKELFDKIFKFFIANFGWAYMTCVAGFVVFCLAVAFSRFGNIRLGKDDEKPEFSLTAWFAMLFAAGMGIGLVFWGVAEPIYHFSGPPFAEPKTPEAASEALRTAVFHWGLHPWACYATVALVLAYFQFRKGYPGLISATLTPLIGEKAARGTAGKVIDSLAVVTTLFGVATSLGLGALQVTTGLDLLYGIGKGTTVSIVVIAVVTAFYITSAVTGINKGIRILSNTNMVMAFGLMALVLISARPDTFSTHSSNPSATTCRTFSGSVSSWMPAAGSPSIPATTGPAPGPSSTGPGGSPGPPSLAYSSPASPGAARSVSSFWGRCWHRLCCAPSGSTFWAVRRSSWNSTARRASPMPPSRT